MECFGARNTVGFSSHIQHGSLPEPSHLTYEGVFNQIKFQIGKIPELPLDLQIGYARYQFPNSCHDSNINDYLALFVKGQKDGKDRDERKLNATICLDVSGSMGGGLGSGYKVTRSRLSLSIQAIMMFISKLRVDDSFGLITFEDFAKVIIPQTKVSDLDMNQTFQKIKSIKTGGGTTIRCGFESSQNMLYEYVLLNECNNCQNRVIMLTDVCDNSIAGERQFLQKASAETGLTLTIIGVSNQFRSQVCEELKNVKGFNYFCAVSQGDIKKYVFQTFDFGFFPSAFNLGIFIQSEDIRSFKVYGSPDSQLVDEYNKKFIQKSKINTISKMKSSFPSEIQIIDGKVHNYGGLILVKLARLSKAPEFKGIITLTYDDTNGKYHSQTYNLNFAFHPEEQFFSNETLRTALEAYTFVSELKTLLEQSRTVKSKHEIYTRFWPVMQELEKMVPESKKEDLKRIKKILIEYQKIKQPVKIASQQYYQEMYG